MGDLTVPVGELRWLLFLYVRSQIPDPNSSGIIETPIAIQTVHGKIEPVRTQTFLGAVQTEAPPTHMIWTRWTDYIDDTHAFLWQSRRPVDQAVRSVIFRVRRLAEMDSRKRFMRFECEAERATWTMAAVPVPAAQLPDLDPNSGAVSTTAVLSTESGFPLGVDGGAPGTVIGADGTTLDLGPPL